MMRDLLKRLLSVEGKLDAQLADLLVLLGYVSIGIYAGGYQYSTSYNDFFALPIKPDPASLTTFVVFLESVVLSSLWMSILFSVAFLFIVFLNFATRNVFRVWFSYLIVCVLAFGTVSVCVVVGSVWGEIDAKRQVSPASNLPNVSISVLEKPECSSAPSADQNAQLLFSNDEFIYFFTPVDPENSEILIDSVSVGCVAGVQLRKRDE
ncbi:MAG: hypothetical protein ABJJ09_20755 [Ascidiaceihabitans sp.]